MATRLTRFLKLEKPRPPASVTRPELPRFREPAPSLAEETPGEQPFRRSACCEAENTRYAERCVNCREELHTPAQDDFNARLWEERKTQLAEERAQIKNRAALSSEDQRLLGESIAEEVAERERFRLDWMSDDGRTPLAVRLCNSLPAEWRTAFLCSCALACAAGFLTAFFGNPDSPQRFVGFLVGVSVVAAFLPRKL